MSQSDYNIANADGATVRADINSQLDAIGSQNSGSTAPPVTFPYMRWFDTANQQLKERNGANTAWRIVAEVIGGELVPYSAGESADARYARLVGGADFDEAPTAGGSPLLTESALASAIATRNIATVRQTTERGPIDAQGRPDLLGDAGGLQVQTKGISASTPLVVVLTLNDDEDYRVRLTSNLGPVTLDDDTDDQQIVLDVTPVQAPQLVVTPIWTFAEVPPSSPVTGAVWYNIRHWGLPQEWDGSQWVDKYYSYPVGQASTSVGSVVDVRSFAFKGIHYSSWRARGPVNELVTVNDNIGVSGEWKKQTFLAKFINAQRGYSVGDIIEPRRGGSGSSYVENGFNSTLHSSFYITRENIMVVDRDPSNASVLSTTNFEFRLIVERGF